MQPINKRKRAVPKPKGSITTKVISFNTVELAIEPIEPVHYFIVTSNLLPKHELRKQELSNLHNIPIKDIFVDPINGVELYRTPRNTWVSNPMNRGE